MASSVLAVLIGVVQIVLGVGYLVFPDAFFGPFGFAAVTGEQRFMYGFLAARFFAYGIGMIVLARRPGRHLLWWDLMALIQAFDGTFAVVHVALAQVSFSQAWFPIVNSAVLTLLLIAFRPKRTESAEA